MKSLRWIFTLVLAICSVLVVPALLPVEVIVQLLSKLPPPGARVVLAYVTFARLLMQIPNVMIPLALGVVLPLLFFCVDSWSPPTPRRRASSSTRPPHRSSNGRHVAARPRHPLPLPAYRRAAPPLEAFRSVPELSPIEAQFWQAWQSYCNVPLIPQYQVDRYRVDFAHLPSKTVIELDGFIAHSSTEQIARDRQRQRYLEDLGWRVRRYGGKEVYHNVLACVTDAHKFIMRASEPKPLF